MKDNGNEIRNMVEDNCGRPIERNSSMMEIGNEVGCKDKEPTTILPVNILGNSRRICEMDWDNTSCPMGPSMMVCGVRVK